MIVRGVALAVIVLALGTLLALLLPGLSNEINQAVRDFFEWILSPVLPDR